MITGHATDLARKISSLPEDRIYLITVGGDGTLNEVINGITDFSRIVLGILPIGSGYNIWSDLHLIGGRDVLDTEDFLVSNILLPGGSLVYLLFCVSRRGWGFDNYLEEVNRGKGMKMSGKLKWYFMTLLPILILIILIQGLI